MSFKIDMIDHYMKLLMSTIYEKDFHNDPRLTFDPIFPVRSSSSLSEHCSIMKSLVLSPLTLDSDE